MKQLKVWKNINQIVYSRNSIKYEKMHRDVHSLENTKFLII